MCKNNNTPRDKKVEKLDMKTDERKSQTLRIQVKLLTVVIVSNSFVNHFEFQSGISDKLMLCRLPEFRISLGFDYTIFYTNFCSLRSDLPSRQSPTGSSVRPADVYRNDTDNMYFVSEVLHPRSMPFDAYEIHSTQEMPAGRQNW
jgi:hypothetical protein